MSDIEKLKKLVPNLEDLAIIKSSATASVDLFPGIVAAYAGCCRPFNALAIQTTGGRLFVSAQFLS